MLALLFAWLLLALVALPLGWMLLGQFDAARAVQRTGDRTLLSLWLGLAACAALLAAISLLTALHAVTGALLLAVAVAWGCTRKAMRDEARRLRDALRRDTTLAGLMALAALAVAAHATQAISAYDAGLYHYQHIQWLGDYGVVHGMGLIHSRFGFAGDWFAVPAVFNHGLLRTRMLTLGGGLVMLLASLHWLLCLQRARQSRALRADQYLLVAFGLMLLYVIDKGWFNAASPDAPVFVLTILVGWLLLLASRGSTAVPLLLALAAVACKVSALPLLLVAAWHVRWPHCWRALPAALALGAVLAAQSFIANGCLAYPLAASCLSVDWGVGAATAARDAADVLHWARWSGAPPPGVDTASALAWLPSWLPAHDVEIALFVVALLALAWRNARLRSLPGAGAVAALALLNIGLGMLSAPDVRFWGGSLFALLGLAGVACWPMRATMPPAAPAAAPATATVPASSARSPWTTLGLIALLTVMILAGLARKPLGVLLLPPALPAPALTLGSNASGVAYWMPTGGDQCWTAPLPCAPARLPDAVRYRDVVAGPASGFTHARSP